MKNATHFVRFSDSAQFRRAVHVFGKPDFVHRLWDRRAVAEVFEGDRVVFAKGDETQPVSEFTWDDSEAVNQALTEPVDCA
jgi:hypothetical protein